MSTAFGLSISILLHEQPLLKAGIRTEAPQKLCQQHHAHRAIDTESGALAFDLPLLRLCRAAFRVNPILLGF